MTSGAAGFRRALAGVASCLVLGATLASPAWGATVSRSGNRLTYTAAAAEANALAISRSGTDFVFTDAAGVTITPFAPCVGGGPANVAKCPAAGIVDMEIYLGDQNDSGTVAASVDGPDITSIRLVGDAGSDILNGGDGIENQLDGDGAAPDGADQLTGGAMDDVLIGYGGADLMTGGSGNDRFFAGAGDDVANGGPGDDSFESSPTGPDGADTLSGGPQVDSIDLRNRFDNLSVSLDGVANDGGDCPGPGCEGDNVGADVENVTGGIGDDVIAGNSSQNELRGDAGDDQVSGGGGYDEVDGGDGADTVRGEGGPDEIDGGFGSDRLFGGKGDDYTYSNFNDGETDVISGGPGIDGIGGGGGALFGVRIDLDGKADDGYASKLFSSNDNVKPDVENLEGSSGPDVLIGSGGPNELDGGDGNDRLIGGGGLDGLLGGRGPDFLSGGKGRDLLSAGAGADRIASRDRTPDEVFCGSAFDRVTADRADRTAADCDRVRRR